MLFGIIRKNNFKFEKSENNDYLTTMSLDFKMPFAQFGLLVASLEGFLTLLGGGKLCISWGKCDCCIPGSHSLCAIVWGGPLPYQTYVSFWALLELSYLTKLNIPLLCGGRFWL